MIAAAALAVLAGPASAQYLDYSFHDGFAPSAALSMPGSAGATWDALESSRHEQAIQQRFDSDAREPANSSYFEQLERSNEQARLRDIEARQDALDRHLRFDPPGSRPIR